VPTMVVFKDGNPVDKWVGAMPKRQIMARVEPHLTADKLAYEEAVSQADQAIASQEWDRAIVLLKAAIRRADPAKNPEIAKPSVVSGMFKLKEWKRDDIVAALRVVAGLAHDAPQWSYQAMRVAQGPLDDTGAVGDPLAADRLRRVTS